MSYSANASPSFIRFRASLGNCMFRDCSLRFFDTILNILCGIDILPIRPFTVRLQHQCFSKISISCRCTLVRPNPTQCTAIYSRLCATQTFNILPKKDRLVCSTDSGLGESSISEISVTPDIIVGIVGCSAAFSLIFGALATQRDRCCPTS